MKKIWIGLLVPTILLILFIIPIVGYFHWLGLFERSRQTVEIERIWTTEEEQKALIATENMDYWPYLNVTRYERGNTTGLKHPSDPNFIDHQVIEDGKKVISNAKRPFDTIHNRFEYRASSHKVEILRLKKSMENDTHQVRIEMYCGDVMIFQGGISLDPSGEVFDDSWLIFPEDLKTLCNITSIYDSVFVVRMGTMLGSHNKRLDMGGGDGVDQLVILNREFDPLIIISQKIRIVV